MRNTLRAAMRMLIIRKVFNLVQVERRKVRNRAVANHTTIRDAEMQGGSRGDFPHRLRQGKQSLLTNILPEKPCECSVGTRVRKTGSQYTIGPVNRPIRSQNTPGMADHLVGFLLGHAEIRDTRSYGFAG